MGFVGELDESWLWSDMATDVSEPFTIRERSMIDMKVSGTGVVGSIHDAPTVVGGDPIDDEPTTVSSRPPPPPPRVPDSDYVEPILRYFEHAHLPLNLQAVSQAFHFLAHELVANLRSEPRTHRGPSKAAREPRRGDEGCAVRISMERFDKIHRAIEELSTAAVMATEADPGVAIDTRALLLVALEFGQVYVEQDPDIEEVSDESVAT